MEQKRKLLIIDGSSMLVTNYFATLPPQVKMAKTDEERIKNYHRIMKSPDGRYTNAVFTTLKAVKAIIDGPYGFTHMAICFDKTRNTFRRELYQEYKANRKPTQEPLKEQFILMEQVFEQIGLKVLYSDQFEADDLAGSVAKQFSPEFDSVRILTKDTDYYQLADDSTNIRLWMLQTKEDTALDIIRRNTSYLFSNETVEEHVKELYGHTPKNIVEFTEEYVFGEKGVYPDLIVELKAIEGDTSDNIPGVKNVSSAAAPLLNEYGSLEGIYEAIDECEGIAKKEKELATFWKEKLEIKRSPIKSMLAGRESAFLSRELAQIKTDIELGMKVDDMMIHVNEKKLKEVCEELGIKKLN